MNINAAVGANAAFGLSLQGWNIWCHKRWLLKNISLEIPHGSMAVVAGPNGSGKTTFLRSIADVLLPSDGWSISGIKKFSVDSDRLPAVRLLSQSLAPAEDILVREFLALSLPKQSFDSRVLDAFGISEIASERLPRLSGGQWQRVRLAQCLAASADLYLLDEPDSYLDPYWRSILREQLTVLTKKRSTVFVSFHRPHEVVSRATHWLGFSAGELMFCEAQRAVFPGELMERLFLGKRLDSLGGVD